MTLFKTKMWSWLDIALLKWSALFFGVVVGAYFQVFVRCYLWLFVVAALLLAIRPALHYFTDTTQGTR
jgi:hypothetical protein